MFYMLCALLLHTHCRWKRICGRWLSGAQQLPSRWGMDYHSFTPPTHTHPSPTAGFNFVSLTTAPSSACLQSRLKALLQLVKDGERALQVKDKLLQQIPESCRSSAGSGGNGSSTGCSEGSNGNVVPMTRRAHHLRMQVHLFTALSGSCYSACDSRLLAMPHLPVP